MINHLFARIRRAAEGHEGRPFLESPAGCTLTYSDMLALSERHAAALAALGAKPGDRIAAQIEKSPEAILLYLGAIRAGAIFLPLNTAYTDSELAYFVAGAEPKILICDPARCDSLSGVAAKAGVLAVETLAADGSGFLPARAKACAPVYEDVSRAAKDLAAILYTSGTTGRAKGAMLTHNNLVSNAETLAALWRFTPQDVLLHALPLYHNQGLFVGVNTVLFSAAKILLLAKFDPGQISVLMPRATVMMGVPAFYTRLLRHEALSVSTTAHMRLFISGSAPLLAETHRA